VLGETILAMRTRETRSVGHIEVDDHAREQMRQADPDQPVVMLNLLKFRERALTGVGVDGRSGQEAFRRYGELNNAADVRYPSRRHFIDKVSDPEYQEISRVRAAALADSRLIELTQLIRAQ
jgi:hypothetical protein